MCSTPKAKRSLTNNNSRPVSSILLSVDKQTRKRFAKRANEAMDVRDEKVKAQQKLSCQGSAFKNAANTLRHFTPKYSTSKYTPSTHTALTNKKTKTTGWHYWFFEASITFFCAKSIILILHVNHVAWLILGAISIENIKKGE